MTRAALFCVLPLVASIALMLVGYAAGSPLGASALALLVAGLLLRHACFRALALLDGDRA